MTITHQTNIVTYTGNGSTTNFPFAFRVDDEDHLIVTKITIADGTRVVVSSAAYTVSGIGDDAGGSVTYAPAISSSYELELKRVVPFTQDLDIQNQGGFFPEAVEDQLDLLEMQIQQTDTFIREVEAELTEEIAEVETELGAEIDAVEAGLTAEIAARIAGDLTEAAARIGADQALALLIGNTTTSVNVFTSRAAAEASTIGVLVDFVWTAGYLLPGDLGAALYKKVVSEPDHDGKFQSVDGAWWEIAEPIMRPEMFGGGTSKTGAENYAAIIIAIDVMNSAVQAFGQTASGIIEFAPGTYQISDTIHIKKACVFRGSGGGGHVDAPHGTILKWDLDKHGFVVHRIDTYAETAVNGAWASGATYLAGQKRYIQGTLLGGVPGRIYSLTTAGPGVTANEPTHTSGSVTGADGYEWKYEAPYSAGDGTAFENLALVGSFPEGGTIGHAIWARARFYANNLYIASWPENGYHIRAAASVFGSSARGNANNWRIYNGRVVGCIHGIYTEGPDVNAGMATGVDCSANRGWGVWDDSFLGNVWVGCHTNGNGTSAARQYDGYTYFCVDITGAAVAPPTDDTAWWRFSSIEGTDIDEDWTTGTTYAVNDVVQGSGAGTGVYKCTVSPGTASTNEPVHATGAVAYADGYTWTPLVIDWISGTTYPAGGAGTRPIVRTSSHGTYRASIAGAGASTDEPVHTSGTVAYPDGYSWVLTGTGFPIWTDPDTTLTEGGCFKMNDGSNLMIGCYAEGGQPAHIVNETLAIYPGFSEGNLTRNSAGMLWNDTINELYLERRGSEGTALSYSIMPGRDSDTLIALDFPDHTFTGRNTELDVSNGTIRTLDGNTTNLRTEVDTLHYTTVTFGRSAPVPHAKFIDRLFLGNTLSGGGTLTAARQVTTGTGEPTSGAWGVGDFVINSAPVAGAPIGWRCITAGSPGTWQPLQNLSARQSITNVAAFTLTPGTSPYRTLYSGVMTADRAVTLSSTGAWDGLTYEILRTATGVFNLNVGTGPLVALSAAKQLCRVTYDGSAWYLSGYETLP